MRSRGFKLEGSCLNPVMRFLPRLCNASVKSDQPAFLLAQSIAERLRERHGCLTPYCTPVNIQKLVKNTKNAGFDPQLLSAFSQNDHLMRQCAST